MRALALSVLVVAMVSIAVPASAAPRIEPEGSGLLRVTAQGRTLLSEASGLRIGFRAGAGWHHATRVAESHARARGGF